MADLLTALLRLALGLRGGVLLGLAHVSFTISLGFGRKRARGSVETRVPAARPGMLCPAGFSSSRGTEGRHQHGYGKGCRASCHVTRKSRPRCLRITGNFTLLRPSGARIERAFRGRRAGKASWWARRELTPHTFRYWILSPARLPIPPLSHPLPGTYRPAARISHSSRDRFGRKPCRKW